MSVIGMNKNNHIKTLIKMAQYGPHQTSASFHCDTLPHLTKAF